MRNQTLDEVRQLQNLILQHFQARQRWRYKVANSDDIRHSSRGFRGKETEDTKSTTFAIFAMPEWPCLTAILFLN